MFDSCSFRGIKHFKDDGMQNYLGFQPVHIYFKKLGNNDHNSAWKSKGLSDERIRPTSTSNNSLTSESNYINTKLRVKLDGSCLKQDKVTFYHKRVINIYIVYEINSWSLNFGKDLVNLIMIVLMWMIF